ncbi:hypothetical protein AWENTII_006496 [Aspergillus wentii]
MKMNNTTDIQGLTEKLLLGPPPPASLPTRALPHRPPPLKIPPPTGPLPQIPPPRVLPPGVLPPGVRLAVKSPGFPSPGFPSPGVPSSGVPHPGGQSPRLPPPQATFPRPLCTKCKVCLDCDKELILQKHAFQKQFINEGTGMGLVATENIPIGSIVISDQVIWVKREEKKACKTDDQLDELVCQKIGTMDTDWKRSFLDLPNPKSETLGPFGGRWDLYHLPMVWDGLEGGVLGPNLAYVNHSCAPNGYFTLTNRYPHDENGKATTEKPIMGRAVVRASTDILKGQEITISYFYSKGCSSYRQVYCSLLYDFRCACKACVAPVKLWETALDRYTQFELLLHWKDVIEASPAGIFQQANDLISKLLSTRITDIRLTMVWVKCALIAAFHSDLARTFCFLTKARRMGVVLQGPTGILYRQLARWSEDMSLMPGFGVTTRGISTVQDAMFIFKHQALSREVLFMVGAKPDEYVRVNRYCRLSEQEMKERDGRAFKILEPKEIDRMPQGKPSENPVVKPEKPCVRKWAQSPGDMRRRKYIPELNPKPKRKRKSKTKPKPKPKKKPKTKLKPKANIDNEVKNYEKCLDSEKDFLDLWLELVNDFLSTQPDNEKPKEEGKSEETTKKEVQPANTKKPSSKGKEPAQTPVVKNVARKKVVVTEGSRLPTVEEASAEVHEKK